MTSRPKTLILNSEQVRCIASPLRSEMMGTAVRLLRFSVNEMAATLNHNPKALYPHIRQMMEVGLLEQVGERLSGKRMEAIYAPVSTRMEIPRDVFDPEYRDALRKKLQAVIRQTERDILRYMDSVEDKDHSFALRFYFKMPPARISDLVEKLKELADWADSFADEQGAVETGASFLGAPFAPRKEG